MSPLSEEPGLPLKKVGSITHFLQWNHNYLKGGNLGSPKDPLDPVEDVGSDTLENDGHSILLVIRKGSRTLIENMSPLATVLTVTTASGDSMSSLPTLLTTMSKKTGAHKVAVCITGGVTVHIILNILEPTLDGVHLVKE